MVEHETTSCLFFQAEDGIRDLVRSRGLGDVYKRQAADKPTASNHDIQHSKWYKKVHKVVLSKTMNDEGLNNTKIISDNLTAVSYTHLTLPTSDLV